MGSRRFTVVVRCADPRVDVFFSDSVLRTQMGLAENPDPMTEAFISNVGGLLSLAGAELPRLTHDVGLLVRLFGDDEGRVVLTAHSSCGGYQDAVTGDGAAVRRRQETDLLFAAEKLRVALPGIAVDGYYLGTEDRIVTPVQDESA